MVPPFHRAEKGPVTLSQDEGIVTGLMPRADALRCKLLTRPVYLCKLSPKPEMRSLSPSPPPKAAGKTILLGLLRDIRGQGLVEYLLALVLIAFASVAAQQTFACHVGCAFESMAGELEQILGTGKKIPPGQEKKCSKRCD
jgi:Flp pilus assembly pilin Flp